MRKGTPPPTKRELTKIRQWARDKLSAGSEPPWAWYQYMKLIESIDAILEGMASTTTENSQQSASHPGRLLQLVEAKSPRDTVRRHRDIHKVRMPM